MPDYFGSITYSDFNLNLIIVKILNIQNYQPHTTLLFFSRTGLFWVLCLSPTFTSGLTYDLFSFVLSTRATYT